jgi:hypothetical protein
MYALCLFTKMHVFPRMRCFWTHLQADFQFYALIFLTLAFLSSSFRRLFSNASVWSFTSTRKKDTYTSIHYLMRDFKNTHTSIFQILRCNGWCMRCILTRIYLCYKEVKWKYNVCVFICNVSVFFLDVCVCFFQASSCVFHANTWRIQVLGRSCSGLAWVSRVVTKPYICTCVHL